MEMQAQVQVVVRSGIFHFAGLSAARQHCRLKCAVQRSKGAGGRLAQPPPPRPPPSCRQWRPAQVPACRLLPSAALLLASHWPGLARACAVRRALNDSSPAPRALAAGAMIDFSQLREQLELLGHRLPDEQVRVRAGRRACGHVPAAPSALHTVRLRCCPLLPHRYAAS